MTIFWFSQEFKYPFACSSDTSGKRKNVIPQTINSHCTLMADSVQVAQPIRQQHLHQTVLILVEFYQKMMLLNVNPYSSFVSTVKRTTSNCEQNLVWSSVVNVMLLINLLLSGVAKFGVYSQKFIFVFKLFQQLFSSTSVENTVFANCIWSCW